SSRIAFILSARALAGKAMAERLTETESPGRFSGGEGQAGRRTQLRRGMRSPGSAARGRNGAGSRLPRAGGGQRKREEKEEKKKKEDHEGKRKKVRGKRREGREREMKGEERKKERGRRGERKERRKRG
ncbi:hypothetical protein, partial [Enterobacter cloacae]|uniref:hypothetical protein n=1 Tax=Enterobacter cloacae TaxID=550 RepID=UPI0021CDF7F5